MLMPQHTLEKNSGRRCVHTTGQALRKMLFTHIVQDVKRINQASRRDAFGQHRSFPGTRTSQC